MNKLKIGKILLILWKAMFWGVIIAGLVIIPAFIIGYPVYLRIQPNAVVMILGERTSLRTEEPVTENSQIFVELYREFWYNLSAELAEKWGLKHYFYYAHEYNFEPLVNNQMLLIFEGWSCYDQNNDTQLFDLDANRLYK